MLTLEQIYTIKSLWIIITFCIMNSYAIFCSLREIEHREQSVIGFENPYCEERGSKALDTIIL